MANIFEELMNHNSSLTESITPTKVTKSSKCNCKKIGYNRFRVESIKIFEDADFDELDSEFAVDTDDASAEDEVVLVIDPEIPADDEVPEDAAEQLVGDYVYKCPICGANYVCACDAAETEAIEVDEDGVPTECPICGDDADQILVGEIAPVDEVKDTEEEHEMEPVESEEDEESEEVEEYDDEGEEFEEEDEEVLEDSLKVPSRRTESFGRKTVTEAKIKVDEIKSNDPDFANLLAMKALFKGPKADKKSYLGNVEDVKKTKDGYEIYLQQKEQPIVVQNNAPRKFYVADTGSKVAKKVGKKNYYDDQASKDRNSAEKSERGERAEKGKRDEADRISKKVRRLAASYHGLKEDLEEDEVDIGVEADDLPNELQVDTDDSGAKVKIDAETVNVNLGEGRTPALRSRRRVKESSLSDDVAKYQKWVDYDMKHYGKISERTQDFLDKAGLEVVKDQYGDYEVTAKYQAEGCKSEGCKEDEDEDKRPMRRRPARKTESKSRSRVKEFVEKGTLPEGWREFTQADHMDYAGAYPCTDGKGPFIYDYKDGSGKQAVICLDDGSPDGVYAELTIGSLDLDVVGGLLEGPTPLNSFQDALRAMRKVVAEDAGDVTESKSLIFANKTFDNLMTKLIRENYKGSPKFVTTKATLKEGKLSLNYTVTAGSKSYKGTLVAEGFNKNASKFILSIKDKGVFTESYTKEPSFKVACKVTEGKVVPTAVKYDYIRKVNEQVYRIRGNVGGTTPRRKKVSESSSAYEGEVKELLDSKISALKQEFERASSLNDETKADRAFKKLKLVLDDIDYEDEKTFQKRYMQN